MGRPPGVCPEQPSWGTLSLRWGCLEEQLPLLSRPRRHLGGGVVWAVQAELRRGAWAGGQFGILEPKAFG